MKIISNDGTRANIKVTEAEVQRMIYTYERWIKTLCEENTQLKSNIDEAYKLLDGIDEYMLVEQHLKLVEAKKLLERGKE